MADIQNIVNPPRLIPCGRILIDWFMNLAMNKLERKEEEGKNDKTICCDEALNTTYNHTVSRKICSLKKGFSSHILMWHYKSSFIYYQNKEYEYLCQNSGNKIHKIYLLPLFSSSLERLQMPIQMSKHTAVICAHVHRQYMNIALYMNVFVYIYTPSAFICMISYEYWNSRIKSQKWYLPDVFLE